MPSFTLITPADGEVVSLPDVKKHLRITSDADNAYLEGLTALATRSVEGWTGRSLLKQQWLLALDRFPFGNINRGSLGAYRDIWLPRGPVRSVDEISYVDGQGVKQILDISDLQIDKYSQPPIIRPAFGKTWPATRVVLNAVQIKYTSGYGVGEDDDADSVPEALKFAILAFIGHLNENREIVVLNSTIQRLPMHVENLLWNDRIPPFDLQRDCFSQSSPY